MKREVLLSQFENSMLLIGKGMHDEQLTFSGCSPAQNHVLMVVGMSGGIGIKQLAEALGVTSGAVTQHVDALEKVGLLARKMNANDRREVVVEVTTKGQVAFQELRHTKARLFRELFGALSGEELQTLVKLVEKVSLEYVKNRRGQHRETV
jgi:DNA-binding MarR family transcriptional regulator